MSDTIFSIGDPNAGHLPRILEPEDSDAWQNPEGETRMAEILNAIVKAGYPGIRIEVHGKTPSGKLFWTLHYNNGTPEGRLAKGLYALARSGNKPLPVEEAMSVLERVYREQGLPLPTDKNAR